MSIGCGGEVFFVFVDDKTQGYQMVSFCTLLRCTGTLDIVTFIYSADHRKMVGTCPVEGVPNC